jgi:hypothetical protein
MELPWQVKQNTLQDNTTLGRVPDGNPRDGSIPPTEVIDTRHCALAACP